MMSGIDFRPLTVAEEAQGKGPGRKFVARGRTTAGPLAQKDTSSLTWSALHNP